MAWSERRFHRLLQAESLDDFAGCCERLLDSTLPHHSVRVSFNDLEFFRPSLIRDSLPVHCDISYLFARNLHDPTPSFLRRHVGITLSSSRAQFESADEPASADAFRDFMRREGWDKDIEVYFWDRQALEAYLCIRRSPSQPAFDPDEMKFLEDFRLALGACIHRLRNQHRERLTTDCLKAVVELMPLPVLILDWQMDPVCFNAEARQLCAEWLHGPDVSRRFKWGGFADVPVEIVRACVERKQALSQPGAKSHRTADRFAPAFDTVPHPTRRGLAAQVELLDVRKDTIGMPHFLVRMQRSEPAASPGLAALSCLTPREREIALLIQAGRTNEEIAHGLSKSVSTVKMQLQSIFRKLGVANRTELAMRVSGAPRR